MGGAPRPAPSWRPGFFVWPDGQTKLVLVGGAGSRTGDAERSFGGLIRFLAERGGYDPQCDVLEASYSGSEVDGECISASSTRRVTPASTPVERARFSPASRYSTPASASSPTNASWPRSS